MVYNDVIEKIGMTIDAAGVVIIVAAQRSVSWPAPSGSPGARVMSTGVSASS